MRIHIPCLEVRDQTRMPQGPHIVQPNHHPRFHGALPARIGSLLFVSSGSVSYQIGSSSLFDTFATRLIAQPLTFLANVPKCLSTGTEKCRLSATLALNHWLLLRHG